MRWYGRCWHSMAAVGRHVVSRCATFRMTRAEMFLQLYLLCTLLCVANAFNLEPRLPVLKLGERGTYFGYSVAEHQILDSQNAVREH
ncbi:hypothetical protein X975_03590, partial [Stegodyphus mimosarum]